MHKGSVRKAEEKIFQLKDGTYAGYYTELVETLEDID